MQFHAKTAENGAAVHISEITDHIFLIPTVPQSRQNDDGVELVIELAVKLLASLDIQSATVTRVTVWWRILHYNNFLLYTNMKGNCQLVDVIKAFRVGTKGKVEGLLKLQNEIAYRFSPSCYILAEGEAMSCLGNGSW